MEIVKKNLVSFICAAVALLAVIFVFFPLGSFYSSLDKKLQGSRKMHTDLKSLSSERFKMPLVDPQNTEALPLEQFPTQKIIAQGEKVVTAVHEQSVKMLDEAIKMNERTPVAPDALPVKKSGAAMGNFKKNYYAAMDELRKKLNCTAPPSQAEFDKEKEKQWKSTWEPMVQVVAGQRVNEVELRAKFDAKLQGIWDEMKVKRAAGFTMYLRDEKVLDYHPGITPPEDPRFPEITDVWAAQLSLWIQQDLVEAIAAINAAGEKGPGGTVPVENAVIKRLVRVEIPKEYVTRTGRVLIGAQSSSADRPEGGDAPVAAADAAPASALVRDYRQSPTGRVCNPLYDVMHFTVTVDVDAQRFPAFLARLTQGKFITVLKADTVSVDRERAQAVGYIYGSSPVVQMTLQCEAIFLREWTVGPRRTWMPPEVQRVLGIGQQPAAPAAGEPAAMAR